MAISPVFTASGLASGLDTNSIVTQLVQIESQPITDLQNKQKALNQQVSQLGSIASRLSALGDAAAALSSGVVQVGVTSVNSAFSAKADGTATAGSYQVEVSALAVAAKARSQAYASAEAPVLGGNLHLDVRGAGFDVAIADGTSLADVATAINGSGAPVFASAVSDGTSWYLSVTNRDSGMPAGVAAADALKFSFVAANGATQGAAPAMASVQTAANAALTVDGLPVTSSSNDVSGVIPGVTLSLRAKTTSAETLALGTDSSGTANKLQTFVNAYNSVMGYVQSELDISPGTDRSGTLAGDPTVRSLQRQLQSLFSATVGSGSIRALPDLGLTTARDGTLSLDTTVLGNALAQDPNAVNAVFSQANTGLSALTKNLVTQYTDSITGALTLRQQGLTGQVKSMDSQVAQMQARIDSFRTNLVAQFTAMEQIVSALKATSSYLNNLSTNSGSGK